ncbi:MAG: tRNA (adenosine(37)-N6)-threonylcarbamoyltransferase complex ATPase subunit type 1 TsaE [Chitinispirillia bacterium]|jgi:tRNA threonylcarbamoyladenosine biosynthesis protein TsaE
MEITSTSVYDTRNIGSSIAKKAEHGDIIALIGNLGAGKTEFARGFIAEHVSNVCIKSPSFSLVNTYSTEKIIIHHFDFYRLTVADELMEIGFEEYLDGDAICLIEWADKFPQVLPSETQYIYFYDGQDNSRILSDHPK